MPNMSYCRFRNTVSALRDCKEHITDENLSRDEGYAREQLIRLCRDILAEWDTSGMDDDEFDEQENPAD